ncbi:agmatinase [Candidatus Bathyarchaeota archaeon]|nr:MAG: agmatinase [Candidatus Bathyarchaeota archaeon]
MSYRELFVSSPPVFSGFKKSFEEAEYVLLGAPLDVTSTFRVAARFAPLAIREALPCEEGYSFRANVDTEELKVHDMGDLNISGNVEETLKRLELVTKELLEANKLPVIIGGEHTITLGAMRSVGGNAAIVSFDAHLDLFNEFMGLTISHATWMRRLHEQVRPEKILEVGIRTVLKEELDYARKSQIPLFTAHQIRRDGIEKTSEKIKELLNGHERIYITIDMDVLDPAFAPGVQNPEPDGLSMSMFLDLLCGLCDNRVVAFDVVEVAPHYDMGVTALQAARTIVEMLCHIEAARKKG